MVLFLYPRACRFWSVMLLNYTKWKTDRSRAIVRERSIER